MAKNGTLRLSPHDFNKAKAALAGLGREAGQYVARIGRAVERGENPNATINRIAVEIGTKFRRPHDHAPVKTVWEIFLAAQQAMKAATHRAAKQAVQAAS